MAKWRKWNAAIHRDLGYLCAGLTVVYAVSGVAVNHRADWNPSYKVVERTADVSGMDASAPSSPDYVQGVLRSLEMDGAVRGTFRPDSGSLRIFLDGSTVEVDLAAGRAVVQEVSDRPALRKANFLHLNHPKKLWTWMADAYAVALAVLAVSGLFILRGRNGITGRGAWLTALGVAVPVAFLFLYF